MKQNLKRVARIVIAVIAYFTITTALIIFAKLIVHYIVFIWNLVL